MTSGCEGGLTTHNMVEARVDRMLIDRANEVVVVADHTKLGRKTFAQIAPLEVAHTVVTDSSADPELIRQFERVGLRVMVARGDAEGIASGNGVD
jgi:DeoR family transcriptional regulator, aga operon transcriptional repressor